MGWKASLTFIGEFVCSAIGIAAGYVASEIVRHSGFSDWVAYAALGGTFAVVSGIMLHRFHKGGSFRIF